MFYLCCLWSAEYQDRWYHIMCNAYPFLIWIKFYWLIDNIYYTIQWYNTIYTCEQEVGEEELAKRRKNWKIPEERLQVHGLLAKYRKMVSSAHLGAVTIAWRIVVIILNYSYGCSRHLKAIILIYTTTQMINTQWLQYAIDCCFIHGFHVQCHTCVWILLRENLLV